MKPSRAMITGELSWAWVALSFAWAGSGLWPFGESYLHAALDKKGLDEVWSVLVGAPAALLMYFSAREWMSQHVIGVSWTEVQLDMSARLRGSLSLALAFSWFYVIYVMVATPGRPSPLLLIGMGGAFFMLTFWIENRRVQRDIKKRNKTFVVRA